MIESNDDADDDADDTVDDTDELLYSFCLSTREYVVIVRAWIGPKVDHTGRDPISCHRVNTDDIGYSFQT